MTKKEAMRQTHQQDVLMELGFTAAEAESLRRISMTLHRWYERECGDDNGCIERDEKTGRAYWLNATTGRRFPVPDREKGAEKRLAAIIAERNKRESNVVNEGILDKTATTKAQRVGLAAYLQTDPRGASLYIIRPGDVPAGKDVGAYYTRGICVY